MIRLAFLVAAALLGGVSHAQTRYTPSPAELKANYERADQLSAEARRSVRNVRLDIDWSSGGRFVYAQEGDEGTTYLLVDAEAKTRKPAFDHARLAQGLRKVVEGRVDEKNLGLRDISLNADLTEITFGRGRSRYQCDLTTYEVSEFELSNPPTAPSRIRVRDGQVEIRKGEDDWEQISSKGMYGSAHLTQDGRHAIGFRLIPGDRKEALVLVSGAEGTRSQLRKQLYDQPGDKLDTYETWVIEVDHKREVQVPIEPIMGGGQPWAGPPGLSWWKDGAKAVVDFPIRGYQQYRVIEIDPKTATAKTLIDEKMDTFVDLTKIMQRRLNRTSEIIWQSERDGWAHLYLIGGDGEVKNQITKGDYVVRSIDYVDEGKRQVWFTASGKESGQDPYHIHAYRVDFDGRNLVRLTAGDGTHTVSFSPDRRWMVDTWSRVDMAPIHVLRDAADGREIMKLEETELTEYRKTGIQTPIRFAAKARDGRTDIYGVVIRPSYWNPQTKFPVIEYIYAGPHDNHVPKSFNPAFGMHALAELGFIVVQIDGMGTNNRGKEFHDVCWQNIGDAGFPDRIAWIKALAAQDKTLDLSTGVGIYGTSAGGQNSTGALLFHPEFYTVGVSSCGCHDNRIDKQWWNEQWMGYPVGDHYKEQSNIENAAKLQGHLMLILGEVDSNVPPESTFRLVDALQKARKNFEFVFLPGANHTGGGTYGERKRRDYFVKHLLGVEPPLWE